MYHGDEWFYLRLTRLKYIAMIVMKNVVCIKKSEYKTALVYNRLYMIFHIRFRNTDIKILQNIVFQAV